MPDSSTPVLEPSPAPGPRSVPAAAQANDSPHGGGRVAAVLFVSAFAFLLASFPARNADVWAHLAGGRELTQGRAPTYAAATGEREFQPWLYDLAVYAMYSVVGGTGLVIVKAMLVAGLAVVLLRVGRTGPGWLIPVVCTVLAILAISTRVPLRPVVASYFLLALTMWLLYAPRA